MGEYADMAIDSMLEYDYRQLSGDFDDDPYFDVFGGRWRGFRPRPQTCKRCGQQHLWWHETNEGWRLHKLVGLRMELHQCSFSYKSAFGKRVVDSDPSVNYNAFLDTVPWPTEEEYARQVSKDNAPSLVSGVAE